MAHHDVPDTLQCEQNAIVNTVYGTAEAWLSVRPIANTPAGWELYDLEVDPTESHNLYGDKEYVLIQEKLKEQFLDLRLKVKAVEINEIYLLRQRTGLEVNEAIDFNWDWSKFSKQTIINSKIFDRFGNPATTEPYIVPWCNPVI